MWRRPTLPLHRATRMWRLRTLPLNRATRMWRLRTLPLHQLTLTSRRSIQHPKRPTLTFHPCTLPLQQLTLTLHPPMHPFPQRLIITCIPYILPAPTLTFHPYIRPTTKLQKRTLMSHLCMGPKPNTHHTTCQTTGQAHQSYRITTQPQQVVTVWVDLSVVLLEESSF